MAAASGYDVIIIGSGAGGGTLAYALAPTGKLILLLERGDYVRREKENWDTRQSTSMDGNRPRRSGATRQGNHPILTRIITLVGQPHFMAPPCFACEWKTSARSATRRKSIHFALAL